jgi:hypothetical protein
MRPKKKNANAKNNDWQVPMDIPGVKPGAYDASMGASGAAARKPSVLRTAKKQKAS